MIEPPALISIGNSASARTIALFATAGRSTVSTPSSVHPPQSAGSTTSAVLPRKLRREISYRGSASSAFLLLTEFFTILRDPRILRRAYRLVEDTVRKLSAY